MKLGRYVVLATKAREFDAWDDAVAFARHNYPSVICERVRDPSGSWILRERGRFDRLWDAERKEWRVMLD